MDSCSNQKCVKSKYILHLRFFKVSTLCLDDSFAHSWHSLNQLHLECLSNSLEGVPTYPSLCGPTHPKPSQLGWCWVIVVARSSDAALHHSPSLSNSHCWNQTSQMWTDFHRSNVHCSCFLDQVKSLLLIGPLEVAYLNEGLIYTVSSEQLMLRCVCYLW